MASTRFSRFEAWSGNSTSRQTMSSCRPRSPTWKWCLMEKELSLMRINRRFFLKSLNTFSRFNLMKIRNALIVIVLVVAASPGFASSRIKDIAHFTSARNNSLIGYGLVIGLKGSGDSQQTMFTQQTLLNMLEKFGLSL